MEGLGHDLKLTAVNAKTPIAFSELWNKERGSFVKFGSRFGSGFQVNNPVPKFNEDAKTQDIGLCSSMLRN